jgi:NADP-dependent 3-hydroxy acid dehydrogenase YdfG
MHIAITGASSGIGAAYARHFAAKGHKLTLVARREEHLKKLARALGEANVHVAIHDLADPKQAAAWIPAAEAALGPIDVLVNNAGVQIVGADGTTVDPDAADASVRRSIYCRRCGSRAPCCLR